MDKYKIVKRLEYCAENKCDICQEENGSGFPWIDGRCYGFTERLYDALALLKAQEPRVMTLEEVLATEVVYAEDIDKAEIIPVLVNRRAHDRIVLVRAHLMGSPSHVIYPLISEYGKRWRCWTSRPTEAEREAIPWE